MEEFDNYQKYLTKDIMHVCNNKTVIEFGPLHGYVTKTIIENNPKKLICVEPDDYSIWVLESSKLKIDEIYNLTANEFYAQYRPANVVVACGLLYHLHSPLHFLELIVNFSNPEWIILDSLLDYDILPTSFNILSKEELNRGGEAFTGKYKTIPLSLNIPGNYITKSLELLGYSLEKIEKNIECRNNKIWGWSCMYRKNIPLPPLELGS
jgi:hypothetical protein